MSRKTKPTNLTLSKGVKDKAKQLASAGSYKSLTALIEELIRQRHLMLFGDDNSPIPANANSGPGLVAEEMEKNLKRAEVRAANVRKKHHTHQA